MEGQNTKKESALPVKRISAARRKRQRRAANLLEAVLGASPGRCWKQGPRDAGNGVERKEPSSGNSARRCGYGNGASVKKNDLTVSKPRVFLSGAQVPANFNHADVSGLLSPAQAGEGRTPIRLICQRSPRGCADLPLRRGRKARPEKEGSKTDRVASPGGRRSVAQAAQTAS